jgi:hypothetical protein
MLENTLKKSHSKVISLSKKQQNKLGEFEFTKKNHYAMTINRMNFIIYFLSKKKTK